MSKIIGALDKFDGEGDAIFCAGGISNCPDWQSQMVELLEPLSWTILNPRRPNFPIHDPDASRQQIAWEHKHLRLASSILFWFPQESICPITLYELGSWSMTDKPLFIGVHPNYPRRRDVEIQTGFVRPEINIVYSLEDLAEQILQELADR
ncbi:MAG: nucleoside 2-deoxyribosyltransferase domain-containing protein [Rivularia sp. (in: cyanobacteria)]